MAYPLVELPSSWNHAGLVIPRCMGENSSVAGDPCIVWDPDLGVWRMVLFYDPPGHAQAICRGNPFEEKWILEGGIPFTNPGAWPEGMHKPFFVLDPRRPGHAAKVDGRYWLLGVSKGGRKQIWRAWSERLAGPWTVEAGPLIGVGGPDAFDARHADAVTGYYFEERETFLYFYMGYPLEAQSGRTISPYGSAQGVAVQKRGENGVIKLGEMVPPSAGAGHWGSGYLGGFQILPGKAHRWIALANASPTPVNLEKGEVWREEPPPSLGGFLWSDEVWPVSGWHWEEQPIEWIEQIPEQARQNGEGTNLWRHYLLLLENGEMGIFYNSGYYGKEQLYLKRPNGAPGRHGTSK